MLPTNTTALSDLTSEAEASFAASIAANVLADAPLVAKRLHSEAERQWYRVSGASGQSVLVLAANTDPDIKWLEAVSREYDLLSAFPKNQGILHPVGNGTGAQRLGMVLHDPGGVPLCRDFGTQEWERLSTGERLNVICQTAKAVRLVHESGLIHGDIRPENCFLKATGEIALTGFGRAGRLRAASTPFPGVSLGAPAYMSPEETGRTNHHPDHRSDLYSLGVTVYELLTGALPFAAVDALGWAHRHLTSLAPKPSARNHGLPPQIDAIVLKLLEKNPEQRYQSARAAESDLQRCLTEWSSVGKVDRFPVARGDLFRHSGYEATLYGRDVARQRLLNSAERVAAGGESELILVTGPAGIGKSSLVAGVHQTLVGRGFLFAQGKFDQNRWETPYSTIVQAFRGLVRQLLAKDELELEEWRTSFTKALGDNAGLMVDLVPELAHVIGGSSTTIIAELTTAAARFRYLFKAFLSVFATAAHPLVIFVDDLQWLDPATLELIHGLLMDNQLSHTLIVVAYRDDEVAPSDPLSAVLTDVRKLPVRATEIRLEKLPIPDLERMLANIFSCASERVANLATIVGQKTGGNPFFAIQFIRKLETDGLLTFHSETSEWNWNDQEVADRSVTQNVAQLLGAQLDSLPEKTRTALAVLALLGNSSDVGVAALVLGIAAQDLEPMLRPAIEAGMVRVSSGRVSFVHDQIQMAAHHSIGDGQRIKEEHLRIGRVLLPNSEHQGLDDRVYEIAGHFDKALDLVSDSERLSVANVLLAAGERAKLASAYTAAQSYFEKGLSVLDRRDDGSRPLRFKLDVGIAECNIVNGQLRAAEERLIGLMEGTDEFAERASVICLTVLLFFSTGRNVEAVDTGVRFLADAGIGWPVQPSHTDVVSEFEELHRLLVNQPIEELVDYPPMTDPHIMACMAVMTEVFPAAYAVDRRLMEFLLLRMTVLSLRHGLCDSSSVAFSALNMALGVQFGDYSTAYKFGELSRKLVDQGLASRYKARVYSLFAGFAVPWIKPLAVSAPLTEEAFNISTATGDMAFAAYNARNHITHELMSGKPLAEVQERAEDSIAFARSIELGLPHEKFFSQARLIRRLRGLETAANGELDAWASGNAEPQPGTAMMICYHWVFRLIEHYLTEDFASAQLAAARVEPIKWAMRSSIEEAEYEFYAGLTAAALAGREEKRRTRKPNLDALRRHHARLTEWTKGCEVTFACRTTLLAAELARLEGRNPDAQGLYEDAIRTAKANGFMQVEAIASELAGSCYMTQGLDIAADAYLKRAREMYLRWGTLAKVRLLDLRFINLSNRALLPQSHDSLTLPVAQLGLDAVGNASRVLSSEVVLASLIEKLMKLVVQHSGAERGVLMLLSDSDLYIEAVALTRETEIEVRQDRRPPTASEVPLSVLQFVLRSQSPVALHETVSGVLDPGDEYFQMNRPRSILCVPVFNATSLIGLLYVENNVVSDVFSQDRTSVLDFLASQAGIWLGNARLYSELQRSEAWLREAQRLSRTGSFYWSDDLDRLECSEEIYRICQLPADHFLTIGGLGELVQQTERADFHELVDAARRLGTNIDRQFKLQLADGSFRDVRLVTRTGYDRNGSRRHLGSLQDVSEMQRTQDVLARVSAELAHVSRTATLGVLAASIAHEVSQPLLGIVANAEACQVMLNSEPPNLDGARRTAARSLRDGNRAAETIRRLRGLFGTRAPMVESFDLNDVVREVLTLAGNELRTNNILVRQSFAHELPPASGDRVQVQQVVLNILLNAVDAVQCLPGGRSISLSTTLHGDDEIRVDITDNGCGFGPEGFERLFEAFYSTKPNGMGVGLSVSKAIIENVGGEIWAAANSDGGATFSFTLKRASNSLGSRSSTEANGILPDLSS
ncbi:AAA family ATPase [Rhizobium sp. BG4]|uniref:trifunctional serine/threonine-protein kinase/ATP-binding protein/sensor histidine kinase n=1 Tax=Rhizobium sp. BG4 TaxID=2613770 RepID=UPI00193CD329|nr:AAA family ATPase [Rhizobium sp. BG4]QRM45827.1 AAA family ATPase [Rhizobium sp. BG4]